MKKYDIGLINGVLHHLDDQATAIKNSFYYSDTLLIIEPNGNNPILKYIEKHSRYHIEHGEKSFTMQELDSFVKQAGGEIVKKERVGFVPVFFPELPSRIIYFFQPLLEKIPLINLFFSAQIILVCKKGNT